MHNCNQLLSVVSSLFTKVITEAGSFFPSLIFKTHFCKNWQKWFKLPGYCNMKTYTAAMKATAPSTSRLSNVHRTMFSAAMAILLVELIKFSFFPCTTTFGLTILLTASSKVSSSCQNENNYTFGFCV